MKKGRKERHGKLDLRAMAGLFVDYCSRNVDHVLSDEENIVVGTKDFHVVKSDFTKPGGELRKDVNEFNLDHKTVSLDDFTIKNTCFDERQKSVANYVRTKIENKLTVEKIEDGVSLEDLTFFLNLRRSDRRRTEESPYRYGFGGNTTCVMFKMTSDSEAPSDYQSAVSRPDCEMLKTAMKLGFDSLQKKGTWKLVKLLQGRRAVQTNVSEMGAEL